ncbi:putative phospholipid:diacylglycerol acyltransferase 2 isoform X2 [Glycine soja]|uniref:Putative phospholipid:diacylglycerol acyltransferase 2 n=1 Tax=Glycine soja TaxID=3848 RepID=A0A445HMK3_GLYSO|nr:putative phospholipid:diacylglycerol acyltransferase 2 isoform X2 [Glycine soja]RZB74939.1 putative phospholipid:diacylglycerol acyltransferase 2 [Glycine soja]
MVSISKLKKFYLVEPLKSSSLGFHSFEETKKCESIVINEVEGKRQKKHRKKQCKDWRCIDYCFWMIGYMCTTWWLLSLLYGCLPAMLLGFEAPVSPGVRLSREGVTALHPVVLVPGIVTGGLELWEGRSCAEGLFRKRLWGDSFAQILKRPLCWLEHLSLHDETGLDPPGIRVRAVPGLVAADNFASGYLLWADLIENLARIGYEGKNLFMAAYDWRLSFQNTEIRDQALSRLKSHIELMFVTNGYKKVVVVPQSMGAIYFLHFLKWVETPPPMGGGSGPGWCDKYIKAIMNVSPAFLGDPRAVSNIFSTESSVGFVRTVASGILNFDYIGRQTLEHAMRVCRTWDSIISLMPKGGETIWGGLDWCLEDWNNYDQEISWGSNSATFNLSYEAVWIDCDEMSRESIQKISKKRAYTARTVFDILNFVAPKMMKRAEAHFSHGIAENLEDPKYAHYRYWSNPLETKLPDAPDMEIYCLYGVGIPTERSHVHKFYPSEKDKSIPFQIDSSADGEEGSWLHNGVYFVDGDESVPIVSSGFMCAKGWHGRTRFNPSGTATYTIEYQLKQPGGLIDRRGLENGASSNIMGNAALIEDVLLVAAGATGVDIGGDRIFSDIMRMSERINLRL